MVNLAVQVKPQHIKGLTVGYMKYQGLTAGYMKYQGLTAGYIIYEISLLHSTGQFVQSLLLDKTRRPVSTPETTEWIVIRF